MNRVSTAGTYALTLANLSLTEQRQVDAGQQVNTQKVATDLKGYGNKAETLTSMRAVQARIAGLLDQNQVLADRFQTQDSALNQISDAAEGARQAITDALASGSVDTLMQQLRGYFSDATAGLNTKSQGHYLFAGGQIDTQPATATTMADLTATASPVSSFFKNDTFVATSQLDETSTINGGMLASNLGTGLYQAFKDVQAYQDANGAFTGKMTDAQRTFLEGALTSFATQHQNLVDATARNGSVQKRVDAVGADLSDRADTLEKMVGKVVNVDMAAAISRLQLAQFAVQASAQVFTTLRDSSLLNYL